MRYANRAKNIENKAHVNEEPKDALLTRFQQEIDELRKQLEDAANGTVFILHIQKYLYQCYIFIYILAPTDSDNALSDELSSESGDEFDDLIEINGKLKKKKVYQTIFIFLYSIIKKNLICIYFY